MPAGGIDRRFQRRSSLRSRGRRSKFSGRDCNPIGTQVQVFQRVELS